MTADLTMEYYPGWKCLKREDEIGSPMEEPRQLEGAPHDFRAPVQVGCCVVFHLGCLGFLPLSFTCESNIPFTKDSTIPFISIASG